ncbi:hypothetical protein ACN28G_08075 [Micromonospora sp. WMMA1923]|uniref:hypothetical protein n=1 Tax=Micromonospora sp. WMMA1923 TaxID=3404125 RepID=UPI003B94F61F
MSGPRPGPPPGPRPGPGPAGRPGPVPGPPRGGGVGEGASGPRPGPPSAPGGHPAGPAEVDGSDEVRHPAVDAAVRAMANAAELSPADQIAQYEAAYQTLRETLASIDQA